MPISEKQKKLLAFPFTHYDALIADGAIRTGKTSIMMIAFVDDAMRRYNHKRFGVCGKTVGSAVKNIVEPYIQTAYARDKYEIKWRSSDNTLTVSIGDKENVFEVFGGRDESSYMLIQGRTLAGVLIDEVALQPRSFVEQACARCSVDGSKLWFNCNPSSPQHWFYNEWIKKPKEHNAIHLRFVLEDNPSLTDKIIERYKSMYSGVFYQRYILGEWVLAEGLVYNFGEENITDDMPKDGEYYISIDYGTMNPFVAQLWCVRGNKAVMVKEYYYSGRNGEYQLTDEQYCDEVVKLADGKYIKRVIVDPSAASFIVALRKRRLNVVKANNDVMDGIRETAVRLQNGDIKIHRNCGNTISEFGLYRWDDKSTNDKVVKENDHCLTGDTVVNTVLGDKKIKDLIGKVGLVWSYNEKKRKRVMRPFFGVRKTRENQLILRITLDNDKIIRCTPDHRILTDSGWVKAKYLTQSAKVVDVMD